MSVYVEAEKPKRKSSWRAKFNNPRTTDRWEYRWGHTGNVSWYILTKEVANKLAKIMRGKKVYEPASGRGYLASQMRLRGVDNYTAIDLLDESWYPEGLVNYGSAQGDAFELFQKDADIVVMTWPPYDDPFGLNVLKHMVSGQVLIFNGESQGGCTGCDGMFNYLRRFFTLDDDLSEELNDFHIRFWGINDHWYVYTRK